MYSSPLETVTQHISVLYEAHNLISRSVLGCGQSGQRVGLTVGNSTQATEREADGECGSGEGVGRQQLTPAENVRAEASERPREGRRAWHKGKSRG